MALDVRRWVVAVVTIAATLTAIEGSAEEIATISPEHTHVRSMTHKIAAVSERASQGSPTFRRMVETIQQSDSYVYIREGDCRHVARACFVSVTEAGGTGS
jgi:hypothetical protein